MADTPRTQLNYGLSEARQDTDFYPYANFNFHKSHIKWKS